MHDRGNDAGSISGLSKQYGFKDYITFGNKIRIWSVVQILQDAGRLLMQANKCRWSLMQRSVRWYMLVERMVKGNINQIIHMMEMWNGSVSWPKGALSLLHYSVRSQLSDHDLNSISQLVPHNSWLPCSLKICLSQPWIYSIVHSPPLSEEHDSFERKIFIHSSILNEWHSYNYAPSSRGDLTESIFVSWRAGARSRGIMCTLQKLLANFKFVTMLLKENRWPLHKITYSKNIAYSVHGPKLVLLLNTWVQSRRINWRDGFSFIGGKWR